jgi:hypothetical protein
LTNQLFIAPGANVLPAFFHLLSEIHSRTMEDELTKPLGLHKPRPGSPVARAALPILTAIIAGSALGWFVQGKFKDVAAPSPVVEAPVQVQALKPEPSAAPAPAATGTPESAMAGNDRPAVMEEAEPSGSMAELQPAEDLNTRQEVAMAHLPDPRVSERSSSGLLP